MSFNPSSGSGRLDNAGGFIGLVEGAEAGAANVTIRNSVFSGKIFSQYQRVAGGIGRSQNRAVTTMTNCLFLGRVRAASNAAGAHASILIQGGAEVVQTASRFESRVMIQQEQKIVNAKSMLGLLSLGTDDQNDMILVAEGADEEAAAAAVLAVLA
jgi:phosphotransferase system HPr (HPr) family protein